MCSVSLSRISLLARHPKLSCAALLVLVSITPLTAIGATPGTVPMVASAWTTKGNVTFKTGEHTVVLAQGGSAELKGTTFSSGMVEFDMKSPGGHVVGLTFHLQDETGDALYFRPALDCATSDDCVQYMRVDHGIFEWDLFGDNQARAPFNLNAWNHVKLSVNGRSMHVWINGSPVSVPRNHLLVGAFDSGAIKLSGPASYAHLTIAPTIASDASAQSPSAASDPHFLSCWRATDAFVMPSVFDATLGQNTGIAPSIESVPAAAAFKHVLRADRTGLVNVTAALGNAQKGHAVIGTWLKTVVVSSHTQVKRVSLGWTREVWVFANGALVYADKNLYGAPAASEIPGGGRLSLDNGSFNLPLKKGKNEIDVLLDDNFSGGLQHFGWGLMMRLPDRRHTVKCKPHGY